MAETEEARVSRISSIKTRPSQTKPPSPPKKGVSITTISTKKSVISQGKPAIDVYNEPLYNEDGSRNLNIPFCLFATRKLQEDRQNNKKIVLISNASWKEKKMFRQAYKKVQTERKSKSLERKQFLKALTKSRAKQKPKESLPRKKKEVDETACPISCKRPPLRKPSQSPPRKLTAKEVKEKKTEEIKNHLKAVKRARAKKQLVKVPPIKTKKWTPPKSAAEEAKKRGELKNPRPVIVIPPFKTRKWMPEPRVKEKKKVVIEYPPVTLRKIPWKLTMKKKSLKKVKPRERLEKLFYPFPGSTLGKRWHYFKCLSKYGILRGHTSQYSKKFNFVTNGKQSTFIAAVALSLAKFQSMTQWKSEHIDEIILYGDINCKRQIRRFRHQNVIRPCEINSKIYLRRAKLLTEICERVEKGCYEPTEMNIMIGQLEDMLKEFSSLLFTYCGQTYALWTEDNAYYLFNSVDTDDKGKLVEKLRGAGCAIRSSSLNSIIDYLTSNFKVTKQRYEICSFRVDKVIKIEEELAKLCPQKKKPSTASPKESIAETIESEVEIQADSLPARPKSGLAAILFRHNPEPIFGNSFQRSSLPYHGFITCDEYLKTFQENRAPFISSVSILMLRVCKSSLWQSTTLSRIFDVGHKLYVENVENYYKKIEERKLQLAKAMEPDPLPPKNKLNEDEDEDEDDDEFSVANIRARRRARMAKPKSQQIEKFEFPITEFEKIFVKIGNLKLEMSVENAIMGKVITRKPEELSLKAGLENLFKKYDHGLVIGPNVVAVWREQNYFFMFDPNHCHQYKRADEFANDGNSCLSWFKNLSDLVKLYIDNLKKDQRGMAYKLCKIESKEFVDLAHDWHNFKPINSQKWILCGKICESSGEFNAANRDHQTTCISLIALAKSKEVGIICWTSETVDEIVRMGDEYYTGCVIKLKEKLVDPNLAFSEINTEFQFNNAVADFIFEESVVVGKLYENDGTFMSLDTGLNVFFEDDDMGVFISSGVSHAILKYDEAYFLFDSRARDDFGRNLKTLDPISSCKNSGAACILRFNSLSDLAFHIISNLEIGDSSTYTINKVEVTLRSSQTPCLYFYKPLGKNSNAAMLRAFDDWHEDIENFKSESETKTLCNLFAALCFTKVLNPNQWNRMDINEILKIGYKLLCNVSDDIWETLSKVEVCGLEMSSQKSEEVRGVFKPLESILPELDRADETIEEQIQIAEIERRETLRKSRASYAISGIKTEDLTKTENGEKLSTDGDESSLFPPLESSTEPKVPLLDILNSWTDKKEVLAILTSSLFNIAIFKMNRVYFIFDPKASTGFGALVQKRFDDFIKRFLKQEHDKLIERITVGGVVRRISKEEEFEELIFGRPVVFAPVIVKPSQYMITLKDDDDDEPVTITDKGSAYVAWFATPELIFQHILSKIPEKFQNQSFKFHEFKISTHAEQSDLSPWNSFEAISDEKWILRATFSQNDSQFQPAHRNNQDVPNCLMSMMFAKLCNEDDWTSTVLDVILKLGDRLFKKSLACQVANGSVPASRLKLKIDQLDLPVFIRPFIINLEHEVVKREMMIKADDKIPLENFKEIIGEFLKSTNAGLLIAKKYHAAIWKCTDEGFMMFDPHDIGPDGIRKSTGFACLQRFLNHADLVDTFFKNIKDLDGLNEFELMRINLIMDHYNCGVDEEFDNQLDDNFATASSSPCLPKTLRAKSTQLCNDSVAITICHAIATLFVSQSLDPEYYTPDIIDRIILLGNELANECLTNDEVCFKDFDLELKTSCANEIYWNFQLNDTFASIQMDIFQRGIISKNPCPLPNLIFSLEEFFNFYSIGLLVTCEFITAMWKEKDNYFIFYACPIDEGGRRCSILDGKPGLVNFKSIFELFNNILGNTENQQAPFELRICSIIMSDVSPEEKTCLKEKPQKTRVEQVMPAVAMRELNISVEKIQHEGNAKINDMIVALKKGHDGGYLKCKLGGFMCGSISSYSKSFDDRSRKYQSSSVCVMCAAMSAIKEPNCWSPDIIDVIITSGNSLYVESSVLNKKADINITSVVQSLCIGDNKLSIMIEKFMKIECIKHLVALLNSLFKCCKTCYVTKDFDYWLLMKYGNFVFVFDPRGINFPSKKKFYKRATLYRLDSIEKAADQLIACISDSKVTKKCVLDNGGFEIGAIDVKLLGKNDQIKKNEKKIVEKKKKKCPMDHSMVTQVEKDQPAMMLKDRKSSNISIKSLECQN